MIPRLPTGEVVPQTVPDNDLVFDHLGDVTLNDIELHGLPFAAFGQSQSGVKERP
jgi:hypothetical protein